MMSDATGNAVTALDGLLNSKDEGIKLEAARTILDQTMADRRTTVMEREQKEETNGKEIDRLAQFILDEFPQAVGAAGAVDTAISIIKSLRDQAGDDSAN